MSGFGTFERRLAKGLERFPHLRHAIKESYKRLIYLIYRQAGFHFALHAQTTLISPESWAGLAENTDECFFGYYDKSPWRSDMLQAVYHRIGSDRLDIIVTDKNDAKEYTVGTTTAWNWQQGAMTQWVPGTDQHQVIYNTIEDNMLGCRVTNLKGNGNHGRFIPWPIQALHPQGKMALTLNYKRLMQYRPDYGYTQDVKNFSSDMPLSEDGVWQIDLTQNSASLIIPLADLAMFEPVLAMQNAAHWVNHIIYSPSGNRFVFLHRFSGASGRFSRLYCSGQDGSLLKLLMDERMVSHYHWQDDNHILVWGRTPNAGDRYYLIDTDSGAYDIVGDGILEKFGDGHCSYSPDRKWIVTDTYPDRARQRTLLLYHLESKKLIRVGRFFSPWTYDNIRRCDLHPRFSHDGKWLSIDSVHDGLRKTYFIDIHHLVV